jgi:hypothetical protein
MLNPRIYLQIFDRDAHMKVSKRELLKAEKQRNKIASNEK